MRDVTISLIGIGGYGAMYCSAFRDPRFAHCRLISAVDSHAASSSEFDFVRKSGARIAATVDELRHFAPADVAIVASPLHFHADHVTELLSMGCHVLCEKPLCADLEQAAQMMAARDAARRLLAIGYQWSYSKAIQWLKSDVLAGVLGAPRRLRSLVLWPRDEAYYRRNSWAGRRTDDAGRPVYDSPVNNAAAHFLHNMLYVLGERADSSASPLRVTAELCRAHSIQNYDTAALRCELAGGVELLFLATHASTQNIGPILEYEFEHAVVRYEMAKGSQITATFGDGRVKNYGAPEESHYQKILSTIECVSTGSPPVCGLEAAIAQTKVMLAVQKSAAIHCFPASTVSWRGEPGNRKVHVDGLDQQLLDCYRAGLLPSEMGCEWATAGRVTEVERWPASPQSQEAEAVCA